MNSCLSCKINVIELLRRSGLLHKIKSILLGLSLIQRKRGIKHLLRFIVLDLLGNQFGFPINGHMKELLFWEKQIAGLGSFAENFKKKIDPKAQEKMLQEEPKKLINKAFVENNEKAIDVIDVGSGVISLLTYAHLVGKINLVATDILSDKYHELLSSYGHLPLIGDIKMVACSAERLTEQFSADCFDIVYCNNALDHTDLPKISLRNMVSIAKVGGYIVISGRSREGTNEHWDGIHNNDLFLEGGKLYRAGKGEAAICLSESMPVETIKLIEPEQIFGNMLIVYRKIQ